MVHHHYVRLLGGAACLQYETAAVFRAIGAQTVVLGGSHLGPEAGILRDGIELGDIAAAGDAGPGAHRLQFAYALAAVEQTLLRRNGEALAAEIVGTTLEECGPGRRADGVPHGRQVPMEQLVLQGLSAGGDEYTLAGEQRGQEIGEGLAGAGAGFRHQHRIALEGLGYCGREGLLLPTRREAGDMGRERTLSTE